MFRLTLRLGGIAILITFFVGCSGSSLKPSGDDADIRELFTSFQDAMKAKDGKKVWNLLDADSQADAERAGEAIRAEFNKDLPEEKAALAKKLGLSVQAAGAMSGLDFINSTRFMGKYDEIPESKLDKITVTGDKATIEYIEDDGDHQKIQLNRQNGQWKLSLVMPRG